MSVTQIFGYPLLSGTDGAILRGADGAELLSSTPQWIAVPGQPLDLTAIVPPGIVRTRATDDGLMAAWASNLFQPLTQAQILAVTGPAPVYPTTLPTLRNEPDGWWGP